MRYYSYSEVEYYPVTQNMNKTAYIHHIDLWDELVKGEEHEHGRGVWGGGWRLTM